MSSGSEEYRARSEDEQRIDGHFVAMSRYYRELSQVCDVRTLGVGFDDSVMREEYAELMASVDMLRENFFGEGGGMTDAINVPTMGLYKSSKREAIERLKLLPLVEMSSYVDEEFPLERIQDWYRFAVDSARKTDEFHGPSCGVIEHRENLGRCRHSEVCPFKMIRLVLLSPALLARFDAPMYTIDPDRQKQLVATKLDVAAMSGVEDRHRAYAVLGTYRRMADLALGHS
jgi:hypothetical protein